MTRRFAAALGTVLAVLLAGCASDGCEATAPTTTTALADATTVAGGDGSFAVLAGEGVPVDLDELAADLEDRLVAAGHEDASVEVAGDRVTVTPGPGPLDDNVLDDLLATPGRLEIRPVLEVLPPDCQVVEPTGTPEPSVYPELDAGGAVVACYSLAPSGLTNDALEDASATSPDGSWVVNPIFTEAGIEAFNALAAECVDTTDACPTGMVALAVDGEVVSAPTVQVASFQRDQIQISGEFTQAEAPAIAASMRVEPLPSGLKVVR